jgi:hemolysin activation/secretion protein
MHTSKSHLFLPAAIAATLVSISTSAVAVGPNVDSGSLLNQSEQEFKLPKSYNKAKPSLATPSESKASTGPTVFIKEFTFIGNSLLSPEILNGVVASYINRELTLTQIKEVADLVAGAYRNAGWTVRVYVPKQEILDGTVAIQVIESTFGGAVILGQGPQRVDSDQLVGMAESMLQKGQHVHSEDIDRALLLLDDLPGVSVAGNLVEGVHDGETNLAISAVDDQLVSGSASVDNQGALATGSNRLNLNLNVNSPLRLGDLVALNALKTEGTDYQRVGYTVPVGYSAWRAGVHASNLDYRVIADEFASLGALGTARTMGWDISYPILRTQLRNLNLAISYDNKKFENTSNGTTTSYGINVYNASLSASQIDNWYKGGSTNASIGLTSGEKSTDTCYSKLNLSLARLQSLSDMVSLYLAVSSQSSSRNLDSSEKLYLGGASGVRAYPASEAGGSEGNTVTLELRDRLQKDLTLTGFYDYGWIKVNHDNNVSSPADPASYYLQGYGLTLAWQASQSVDMKATIAQRIGNNPAANTTTGMDADGTRKITRIWLSTGIAF